MTAADVVARVRAAGLSVEADGGDIVVRPRGRISSDLRSALIAHKGEVLELLRAEGTFSRERCSWCSGWIVTVPGVLALSRRTALGDVLHPKCWADSTRDPGGHQPRTPDLDAAIARANARTEWERKQ